MRGIAAGLAGALILFFARFITAVRGRWTGVEPVEEQRIYFANHTSHLDTIVIWASLPPQLRPFVRPVAAKDYWEKGLLRRRIALDELNVVLVDRRRTEHSNPLDPVRQALQEGSSLIIFPEGTRRPQPLPSEFKSGIWRLMKEFPQVELIPVYIENLHRAMPKGVLLPVPTVCAIRYGAPLEHYPEDLKEDFLERARNAIISLAQP